MTAIQVHAGFSRKVQGNSAHGLSYPKAVVAQYCAQANFSCLSAGSIAQAFPYQEISNFLLSQTTGRGSSCLSAQDHENNPLASIAVSDLTLSDLAWLQWWTCFLKAGICFVETKKCPSSSEENAGTM